MNGFLRRLKRLQSFHFTKIEYRTQRKTEHITGNVVYVVLCRLVTSRPVSSYRLRLIMSSTCLFASTYYFLCVHVQFSATEALPKHLNIDFKFLLCFTHLTLTNNLCGLHVCVCVRVRCMSVNGIQRFMFVYSFIRSFIPSSFLFSFFFTILRCVCVLSLSFFLFAILPIS